MANNGSNTIQVFSPDGADLGSLPTVGLSGPIGLAFDGDGNLYVVNNLTSTIEQITPGGTESFFATTGFSPAFIAVQNTATLVNISTRLNILTGDNVLDGGFIVVGSGFKDVLIRGLGPSLASAGITGALADPIIELHSGTSNVIIAENDNWMNNQKTEIEATGLQPSNDAEAALITTLAAGTYTVIERGKQATTGIGLIEIYDLGGGAGPELANISTRGFVGTGSSVMIAGFIVASTTGGSSQVVVRGLGPSLAISGLQILSPIPCSISTTPKARSSPPATAGKATRRQRSWRPACSLQTAPKRRSLSPSHPAPTPRSKAARMAAPALGWWKLTTCIKAQIVRSSSIRSLVRGSPRRKFRRLKKNVPPSASASFAGGDFPLPDGDDRIGVPASPCPPQIGALAPAALQTVPLEHLSSGALMLLDRGGDLVRAPPKRGARPSWCADLVHR